MDASKCAKYGSSSCSLRFWEEGGKRPNTWGPGIECAAVEAIAEYSGGDVGVPLEEVLEADLSFADDEGTGNQL